MRIHRGNLGCAVSDMYDLNEPDAEKLLSEAYKQYYYGGGHRGQFVIWAHKDTNEAANNIEKYVKEHGLGEVWKAPPAPNPNYVDGHTNSIWVWTVNQLAWKAWGKERNLDPIPVKVPYVY